jgi:hypothetical protein
MFRDTDSKVFMRYSTKAERNKSEEIYKNLSS